MNPPSDHRTPPPGEPERPGQPGQPGQSGGSGQPDEPRYADRTYRSVPSVVTGVAVLVIGGALVVDAALRTDGRELGAVLAATLLVVPLVVAYTLRPMVAAGHDRLLVRNPFRTVVAPWSTVEHVRAGMSSEVVVSGRTYQLWAVPVSLRQRKKAQRDNARAAAEGRRDARSLAGVEAPGQAWADHVVTELRELAEAGRERPGARGEPRVRWCWWIIAPAVAGLVALVGVLMGG
ncbi:PH domain-containing protein [Allostreptomyces psammosilenae]|uniref:Low molecular weight protein antigen 6 PH domain-containing protein n=1 Tax=Allostreptomyces psammosilenae TaxID=1892865 RepID=A0A853A070_9ACTN|nr:PH domain-containing protein [Allostreptomyces psammosilenae]NYI08023.1 hypothetical protein [Allostreptomyces psammosilenae]